MKLDEEALNPRIAAAIPRTAVARIGGSASMVEAWKDRVPAILKAWYRGKGGGRANADVLRWVRRAGFRCGSTGKSPACYRAKGWSVSISSMGSKHR